MNKKLREIVRKKNIENAIWIGKVVGIGLGIGLVVGLVL